MAVWKYVPQEDSWLWSHNWRGRPTKPRQVRLSDPRTRRKARRKRRMVKESRRRNRGQRRTSGRRS